MCLQVAVIVLLGLQGFHSVVAVIVLLGLQGFHSVSTSCCDCTVGVARFPQCVYKLL